MTLEHAVTAALAASREAPPSRAPSSHAAVLAIVLASYLMIVLDISIVVTALPKMQASPGFSAAGLSWVPTRWPSAAC